MNNNSINNYFNRFYQSDKFAQSRQLFLLTGLSIVVAAMTRRLTKPAMFMLLGFMLLSLATVGTLRAQHPAPDYMLPEKGLVTPQKTESIFSLKPENILSFNLANQLTAWTQSQISYRSYNDLVANQTSANFSPDSTFIVTNTNNSGAGSLRQAIIDANSNPDASSISFNINPIIINGGGSGSYTINLQSGLPSIDTTMTIDASTQPGFENQPLVELNGAGAGNSDGLIINANNCVIKGFVINRFNRHGIFIGGSNNTVAGNYIGTNLDGTGVLPVLLSGVFISGNSNTIGGTTAADRNVISGNGNQGIGIPASGNNIKGNYIGTNATGTAALGGGGIGIFTGASNNIIGGSETGARNIISGNNRSSGVDINTFGGAGATGNIVQGNYIGTNATGTAALPNFFSGVSLSGVSGNIIGGTSVNARNVISGNTGVGITIFNNATNNQVIGNYVGTNAAGTAAVPNVSLGIGINNSSDNTIGGTEPGASNLISGNGSGVSINTNASGNILQGNYIGTDVTGTNALGNTGNGISIVGSSNNVIGGTSPAARNVISGNRDAVPAIGTGHGIVIGNNANANIVQGNYIGTDISGTQRIPNIRGGVFIFNGASGNTIGGLSASPGVGPGNLISGNTFDGISIQGISGTFASANGNRVQGNFIGTDITGTAALANNTGGIRLSGNNNTIGGSGASNVIAFNGGHGVNILCSSTVNCGTGNAILSNTIKSNIGSGIFVSAASNNLMGGTSAGDGNIVTNNGLNGITIQSNASGNLVQGNFVGVGTGGEILGNSFYGIFVNTANNNTIGGTSNEAGNIVAFNGLDGVNIRTGSGNGVLSNSIYSNVATGIILETNGNNNQTAPTINSASGNENNSALIVGQLVLLCQIKTNC